MELRGISRRRFFKAFGAVVLSGTFLSRQPLSIAHAASQNDLTSFPERAARRARRVDVRRFARMLKMRLKAFRKVRRIRIKPQRANADQRQFGANFAYTKALPKNNFAEPNDGQFRVLIRALAKGKMTYFEDFVPSGAKGFKNPLAAHAVDLEGSDPVQFSIPPAPTVSSSEGAAEMEELYWKALVRDVKFADYWSNDTISRAALDLTNNFPGYVGPKVAGQVTPGTIFRSSLLGRTVGPFISQLLYKEVLSGRLSYEQKIFTTAAGSDWMTDERYFNFRQSGNRDGNEHTFLDTKRYILTGRDLAMYVWDDRTFMPYIHAFLILFTNGVRDNRGNPYRFSRASVGFLTGSYGDFLTKIGEVASRALKAAWWQKWNVHMRLRPEELAGRIHFHRTGQRLYPHLPNELVFGEAVSRIQDYNGSIDSEKYRGNASTYLLPQAYPEGAPTHPSYPSGHATVAGACCTLLKAFFDESEIFPDPVIPNEDGSELVSYTEERLTVHDEINKLASNISEARNFAGIHYRTDMEAGLRLGEAVAIDMLRQWNLCYAERFRLQFTKFDGTKIVIR